MFCCGLDPSMAEWLAESEDRTSATEMRVVPLVALIGLCLGLVALALALPA